MTIRQAELKDLEHLLKICNKFYEYSEWSNLVDFDEDSMYVTLYGMIKNPNGCVFFHDEGLIAGVITPLFFNAAFLTAQEVLWYAKRDGEALRKKFEDWSEEVGADLVRFSCLCDGREEHMRDKYKSKGYTPLEVSFGKVFE